MIAGPTAARASARRRGSGRSSARLQIGRALSIVARSTTSPTSSGAGVDDVGDAGEEGAGGAVVDRHQDRRVEQAAPERDDPLGPVLGPDRHRVAAADALGGEPRRERARRRRDLVVPVRPGPIAVVVGQEFAGDRCDVLEEVDQRAPRHLR